MPKQEVPKSVHRRRDDIPLEQYAKIREHRRAMRRAEEGYLSSFWRFWIISFLLLAGLGALGYGGYYVYQMMKPTPLYIDESVDSMTKIMEAMRAYMLVNDSLPPAYMVNSRGEKTVSWRVLLLPYFKDKYGFPIYKSLYEQFNLDESWEHPTNRRLLMRMPSVYLSPVSSMTTADGRSNYVTIRHPDSVFPDDTGMTSDRLLDSPSETVAVVEVSDGQCVWWTQPDDFRFDPCEQTLSSPILTHGGNGLVCGMCDGKARFIRVPFDPRVTLFGINARDKNGLPYSEKELTEMNPWTYLFLRNNGTAPNQMDMGEGKELHFDPQAPKKPAARSSEALEEEAAAKSGKTALPLKPEPDQPYDTPSAVQLPELPTEKVAPEKTPAEAKPSTETDVTLPLPEKEFPTDLSAEPEDRFPGNAGNVPATEKSEPASGKDARGTRETAPKPRGNDLKSKSQQMPAMPLEEIENVMPTKIPGLDVY